MEVSECLPFCPLVVVVCFALIDWLCCLLHRRCCRRDEGGIHPHLTNGGKYLSSIVVCIVAYLDMLHPNTGAAQGQWSSYRWAWLVASIINSLYKMLWDIRMDWGLLRMNCDFAQCGLRKDLHFRRSGYYHAAIGFNILVRFSWTLVFLQTPLHIGGEAILSFVSLIEIVRRAMWNIFRVESQHLANCGQGRAVKELFLPFDTDQLKSRYMVADLVTPLLATSS